MTRSVTVPIGSFQVMAWAVTCDHCSALGGLSCERSHAESWALGQGFHVHVARGVEAWVCPRHREQCTHCNGLPLLDVGGATDGQA